MGLREIRDGFDIHSDNQQRFRLPTRLVAKTFQFKLIYGGTAGGFANDIEFGAIGNQGFWQNTIDAFYAKYQGLHSCHIQLVDTAIESGVLELPTGRRYIYPQQEITEKLWYWRPKILNYPVQGFGAEMMMLARCILYKKLKAIGSPWLFVNSVHDSILLDGPIDNEKFSCYNTAKIMKEAFEEVPAHFKRLFGVEFNLPFRVEIKMGMGWENMKEVDFGI